MTEVRRHVVLTGVVQGVGFRYWSLDEARRLGLTGWVRNRPDGRLEAEFQGPADGVEWMLRRMREGPPGSTVETATATDVDAVGDEHEFRVLR